jgi:hypothetical protein
MTARAKVMWEKVHKGIEGSKQADREAKNAAERGSSRPNTPSLPQKAMWSNKTSMQNSNRKLTNLGELATVQATTVNRPQSTIRPLPTLDSPPSHKHSSLLTQLHTGHRPLAHHLLAYCHQLLLANSGFCYCIWRFCLPLVVGPLTPTQHCFCTWCSCPPLMSPTCCAGHPICSCCLSHPITEFM